VPGLFIFARNERASDPKHLCPAIAVAPMKVLQLTAIVRDMQTATMVAQSFIRSPVLVGRQFGNQLRLDARVVSRRPGAFLFSKDGLQ
jgi:hypothetical protein